MDIQNSFFDELVAGGIVSQSTDDEGLRQRLNRGPITLFCGFDPTADSLHVGSLKPLMVLRRFQRAGHQVIALIGGATGFIGDPSGRSTDRLMLSVQQLNANREGLRRQIASLLPADGNGQAPIFVDNREWLMEIGFIDLLREFGIHFRVNEMLRKDSVQNRLHAGDGMTFTEFSYSLLQAIDFEHLRQRFNCELQIGGSDQWGNITAGLDLMRRRGTGDGFGLVWPLMVKQDGTKFGKSADGNVWLDPQRTSPFTFFQFWMTLADKDAVDLLLPFCFQDVAAIRREHLEHPEKRLAQSALAEQVTAWVHGEEAMRKARSVSRVLFFGEEPDAQTLAWMAEEAPITRVPAEDASAKDIVSLANVCGVTASRSDARRLIQQGGLWVNGERATLATDVRGILVNKGWMVLRKGQRHPHLIIAR